MMYILTAGVDHESETLLFVSDSLGAIKAHAETHLAATTYVPDDYNIYEARLNAEPQLVYDTLVRYRWEVRDGKHRYSHYLAGWEPA